MVRLYCFAFFCLFFVSVYADEYKLPSNGNDIVGRNYTITVKNGDNLTSIRQNHGVSYDELLESNPGIDFYKLKVGQQILIPKQFILPKFRNGIVINTSELRLYYFTQDGKYVYTFPVGLGRVSWRTPLAEATIVDKRQNPTWRVPNSIKRYVFNKTGKVLPDEVPPGPENPLGSRALYLSKSGYLIHGTNAPRSVGTFISSGCMRMLREPIELLYQEAQIGTPVHIIHHPNKVGWRGEKLYLESHRSIDSYSAKPVSKLNELDVRSAIYDAINMRPSYINWERVYAVTKQHIGIPYQIGFASNLRR